MAGRLKILAYLAGILWLNLYICRQAFFLEWSGQTHSMHGLWTAMARLASAHWLTPSWWPYWYGGMPFESAYAPLVPGLAAAWAKLAGSTPGNGLHVVLGAIYLLGPAALFLLAWQLTGKPGWSFFAAIVYSLTAPTELILPDARFDWAHLGDARRFYLNFVWDEGPHLLALSLSLLAAACFHRAFTSRAAAWYAAAGALIAGALLASAFGATASVLLLACLLPVHPACDRRALAAAAVTGLAGYLVVSPWLPPSLLGAIRANTRLDPHSAWTPLSGLALAGVLAGGALLWWVTRGRLRWQMRFLVLLAFVTTAIPVLYAWKDARILPQPGRYKVEMELALVLLVVFATERLASRLPAVLRVVLALALLYPGYHQVVAHRKFSKSAVRAVDPALSIESRVARWLDANLAPGSRVFAPGSIAQWLNAFGNTHQFTGGSYPTAPSTVQQMVMWGVFPGGERDERDDGATAIWLRAYGVEALIVSGPESPEFWKPYREPGRLESAFPLLWKEQDTAVLGIPRRRASLAHVVPEAAVARREPAHWLDTAEARRFVEALEDPRNPPAEFAWLGRNHARIHAKTGAEDAVAVQVAYHPGWRAAIQGRPIGIQRDGLGQMALHPGRAGECVIDLRYDGGWEALLCRLASGAALLGAAVWLCRAIGSARRRRSLPQAEA